MRNIKINKMRVFNFKLFNEIELSFNNADFIILDGPNGYGKTSIYDSIELLITGRIERIKRRDIDGRTKFADNVFVLDQNLEKSYIRIEFLIDDKKLILSRHANLNTESRNNPGDFSAYKLYRLPSLETEEADKYAIEDSILAKAFGSNLQKSYPLMYYIEQEESTFYLKKNEKERKEYLSYLFNTIKEEGEFNRLKQKDRKLKDIHENLDIEKSRNENKLSELTKELLNLKDEKPKFQKLLVNNDVIWDKESPIITLKQFNSSVLPWLEDLLFLRINSKNFKQAKQNKEIDKFLHDDEVISYMVTTNHFKDDIPTIKKAEKNKKTLQAALKVLSNVETIDELDSTKDLNDLLKLLETSDEDADILLNRVLELKNQKKVVDDQKKFYNEINETRKLLISRFKHNHNEDESECPLCGTDFEKATSLESTFKKREEYFKKFYGDAFEKHEKAFTKFLNEDIADIIRKTKRKLNSLERKYPPSFFPQLITSQDIIDKGKRFAIILENLELDVNQYTFTDTAFTSAEAEKKTSLLKFHLESFIKPIDEQFYDEKYFDILKKYFNDKFSNITKISTVDIKSKISYLEYKIYESQNDTLTKIRLEIQKQKAHLVNIKTFRAELKKILTTYQVNIDKHKTNVISAIEIPFFVYSGRVIQSFNRGVGFFINTSLGEELRNIKFLAGHETEHDAVMSLSSGQLSALILSFTLALNKVYAQHNILLIDDPVQTMDEVNILSLVELLRSDFSDRQIILSTHEDHISLFLKYKFGLSGNIVTAINMKNKMLIVN